LQNSSTCRAEEGREETGLNGHVIDPQFCFAGVQAARMAQQGQNCGIEASYGFGEPGTALMCRQYMTLNDRRAHQFSAGSGRQASFDR
jgi:hypothetical protein